ncbi:MAG: cytochrome c [Candidatus Eisenbacteria bacterium]|nr:cytochrome c [Candidatus Eisenbacteria bacterium]
MKVCWRWALLASALAGLAAAGCGGQKQEGTAKEAQGGGTPPVSKYDRGPRAFASPMDDSRAAQGEQLFQKKGCSACHAFGRKLNCPDLKGVTGRRTAEWMENQILHPEIMIKEDPISRQLFTQFALQMPNQGLTQEEARAVIEFFKKKDREPAAAR